MEREAVYAYLKLFGSKPILGGENKGGRNRLSYLVPDTFSAPFPLPLFRSPPFPLPSFSAPLLFRSRKPITSVGGQPCTPFNHAELKPISPAGWNQFNRQLDNWRSGIGNNAPHIQPGEGVGLFGYDAAGKIHFFGVW